MAAAPNRLDHGESIDSTSKTMAIEPPYGAANRTQMSLFQVDDQIRPQAVSPAHFIQPLDLNNDPKVGHQGAASGGTTAIVPIGDPLYVTPLDRLSEEPADIDCPFCVGGVGKCFLNQLNSLKHRYPQISLALIARSSKILFSEDFRPLSLSSWETDLAASTQPVLSLSDILSYLRNAPGPVVLVDNTSNQDVAEAYPMFLKQGISVVTPNKKACSSSYALWDDIFTAARGKGGGMVYHESSVGAGLPVISTLNDLVETGDEVHKIEGVFSGTMSFLFNSFAPLGGGGGKFSEEVIKAKDLGYTEPDPRDDLNGLDVARKLTILARIAGLKIESPTSFPVQSLIPKDLETVQSADEFLAKLPDYDSAMENTKREAEKQGKVVRYVGSIDVRTNDVKVGLETFDKAHPIAALKGSDNIISFYTKRYGANALIIQGAG
ncbi:hypothetical protein MMC16_000232 [Acarospora aff. strigata]|nr:hypothetical protein [Acarospora aff. strigata]